MVYEGNGIAGDIIACWGLAEVVEPLPIVGIGQVTCPINRGPFGYNVIGAGLGSEMLE